MATANTLKQDLKSKAPMMGTFVKTPSPIIVEVLADTGLDFLILDAEHAPFGREALDLCVMTARLKGCRVVVRIPDDAPGTILNALDLGADGIMVPHVKSAAQAEALVKAAHYGAGGRGYAGSTRAAGYGTVPMARHKANSAANTVVIAQIEDPEGVDAIEDIAAVEGLDCLFIGRVDLAVAYGATSMQDAVVEEATMKVCQAGRDKKMTVGMFLPDMTEVPHFLAQDVSFFGMASEHKMIQDGFRALLDSAEWAEAEQQASPGA
ncbi:HpcH/HpaI aldolase family protein [Zobellella maritima]|uniref:HpcH/HpaI aldolase family protein n=1 Tax=Zobellella maritima TaxID=2059725 RepID=UPI000E30612C|nr:aldolase/citrate lyase family protein [Zobellella maritima]